MQRPSGRDDGVCERDKQTEHLCLACKKAQMYLSFEVGKAGLLRLVWAKNPSYIKIGFALIIALCMMFHMMEEINLIYIRFSPFTR